MCPYGHACELVEDGDGERRLAPEVELEVEDPAAAGEVVVELAPGLVERPRDAEDARAGDPGQPLELLLGIGVVRDPREAAIGDRREERAELAVDDVVGGVEHPGPGGGVAEALVEIGGNGHWALLRSRRTPEDVAWRAASGLESSAAAICS